MTVLLKSKAALASLGGEISILYHPSLYLACTEGIWSAVLVSLYVWGWKGNVKKTLANSTMPFKLDLTVSSRAASPPVCTKASVRCPASKPKQKVRSAESITHQSHIKHTQKWAKGDRFIGNESWAKQFTIIYNPDRQKKVRRLAKLSWERSDLNRYNACVLQYTAKLSNAEGKEERPYLLPEGKKIIKKRNQDSFRQISQGAQ